MRAPDSGQRSDTIMDVASKPSSSDDSPAAAFESAVAPFPEPCLPVTACRTATIAEEISSEGAISCFTCRVRPSASCILRQASLIQLCFS